MKPVMHILVTVLLSIAAPLLLSSYTVSAQSPEGAWKIVSDDTTTMLIITPGYFSCAVYTEKGKSFIKSFGGKWMTKDKGAELIIEFNTQGKGLMEKLAIEIPALTSDKMVTVSSSAGRQEWTRVDNGSGELAGDWRITAREQNGKMNPMRPGARKTVKILSGSRFQWIAMNTETGEFFGTGGGSYTFKDGVYTENIAFFSRDCSRVGASLTFKGKVSGNDWDHSGLSSKGDPIHEVWSRQ